MRAEVLTPDEASNELGYVLDVRAERVPADQLTPQALALASVRGLSAYDATCLALALGTDSILVTADRRLAAEAERSALLPERGPT